MPQNNVLCINIFKKALLFQKKVVYLRIFALLSASGESAVDNVLKKMKVRCN